MKRTTTPTHIFKTNIDPLNLLDDLQITYTQNIKTCDCGVQQQIILVKTLSDCVLTTDSISVTLTQEETNLFSCGGVNIQLHAKMGTSVLQSNIVRTFCYEVLNDEVI